MQKKSDIVVQMADALEATQSQIKTFIDTYARVIACSLAAGENTILPGLGKLTVHDRPARTGRNPNTGAEIAVAASRRVKFKASKSLRDMVEA